MPLQIAVNSSSNGPQYAVDSSNGLLVPISTVVVSSGDYAVFGNGGGATVQIFGFVGGLYGVSLGGTGTTSDVLSVGIGGTIASQSIGVSLRSSSSMLVNFGQINSALSNAVTFASATGGLAGRLYNYGTIQGGNTGILAVSGAGDVRIYNYGTISCPEYKAIYTDLGNDRLVNRGRIEGDVDLYSGNDILLNRGLISADVLLGNGTDLLDNRGGTIDGNISLGSGTDTFIPGSGIEIANGGTEIDTLDFTKSSGVRVALDGSIDGTGWAKDDVYTSFEKVIGSSTGNDTLIGDGGDNFLTGLGGNDILNGQSGADTLYGGRGVDTLNGGDGNDFLYGEDGNDILVGGAGFDQFTGGTGADKFVFTLADVAGSQKTPGTYDVINDFKHAEADKIDLSAIDANVNVAKDQAFTFIGTSAFHNVAGELKLEVVVAGYFVQGDTNGDGVADFTIAVAPDGVLVASDFVL